MRLERARLEPLLTAIDPRLRLARPDDGPRIEALLSGVAALEWPDLPDGIGENVTASLQRWESSGVLLVIDEPRVIGAVAFHLFPDLLANRAQILVDDVFVDVKQRAKGVGSAMVRGLLAVAELYAASHIYLHLSPTNLRAQKLVEKHGFAKEREGLWCWAGAAP